MHWKKSLTPYIPNNMLTGKYLELFHNLRKDIPSEQMLHDALSTLAFGTDASFYRLIPQLVIHAYNEHEIIRILEEANKLNIPVTFRAAGTSLSGQAISDSVLVIASHGWEDIQVLDNARKVRIQAGVRGSRANQKLAAFDKKIGPDPASIDSAMIGGIAANNASGMCCGTSENSYKTVEDIRVILADGTLLDTADPQSVEAFKKSHATLCDGLERMAAEIAADSTLRERIQRKYKIKNTTGYSLNALVDYRNCIDILKHLIIGSEGTLAFISDITYRTVQEHRHKALALVIYPTIRSACEAVQILQSLPVSAVELMDRAALHSVENTPGVPQVLKTVSEEACALLVETRAESISLLQQQVAIIEEGLRPIETELPYLFTTDKHEQAGYWKIRKETLPTVAGMRKSGTTAIIEDVCFPGQHLADATMELRKIFEEYGYQDAVIFGHALAGNLHFMFNQDFQTQEEVDRYSRFMDAIATMVVDRYDGSLKAEHGTGRNMAPYVEMEWGKQAYALMKEIKRLFDPNGILNPGVILNEDHRAHVSNLKPIPSVRPTVDKCMECGFCEGSCVAEGLTLSPRQRVAAFREMQRLATTGEAPHRSAEMHQQYQYWGLDTCATDSLCGLKCPVKVDTGKLVKELRHEGHSAKGEQRAVSIANHMDTITAGMRLGLNLLYGIRCMTGKKVFGAVASGLRSLSGERIPLWNEHFPKGAHRIHPQVVDPQSDRPKVVYFPSCITRSMGVSKSYSKEVELTRITEILLKRAGYDIIYPQPLDKLCCGMAFSSKGYVEAGKRASDELEAALQHASENGKYPILCDMSPCLYTMHTNMDERLKLYEPAEFAQKFLLDRLSVQPVDEKIAIFAVCSAKKLGVDSTLVDLAKRCAKEVVVIQSNCCGFAGDRGFLLPALNTHGLRMIREQVYGCSSGYATSRTCEIGLSRNSGLQFQSILYLLERCSRANREDQAKDNQ